MSVRFRHTFGLTGLALAACLAPAGCSGSEKDFGPRKDRKRDDSAGRDDAEKTDGAQTGALTPVAGKGTATLKGIVKLAGGDPDYKALTDSLLADINKNEKDRDICLAGTEEEKTQFVWRVDRETKGVNNVFVWIRPEDDTKQFFDVSTLVKEGKGFAKSVNIDQPHCAFMPHAVVLFPRYVGTESPSRKFSTAADKSGPPATGQEFKVLNSSPIGHNTSWTGDTARMRGGSQTVPPRGGQLVITDIQPSYKGPVNISCSVHPWMKANVWAFEHPFAAVSGSVKEWKAGEFKIENIPAGVKLRVVAWHESAGFLNGGAQGEVIELKEGDNDKNFEVKYSK